MSSRQRRRCLLQKHAPLMRWIAKGNPKVVRAVIGEADKDLINTFSECCHNIIEKNVELTPEQKRQLKPQRKKITALLDRKTSLVKKKKALQTGGFASALAKIALPTTITMLSNKHY